jgi:hypothetical protein
MFLSCANEIRTWNCDSFELINEHVYFNKTKPINNFVIRHDSIIIFKKICYELKSFKSYFKLRFTNSKCYR